MKGFLSILFICLFATSCTTYNFFEVYADEDIIVYQEPDSLKGSVITVPLGSPIYLEPSKVKIGYTKVRYGKRYGWAYRPRYKVMRPSYTYQKPTSDTIKSNRYIPSRSYTPSSSGTVHVKGYYRKDGTYVRPHTRRAPRRR